MDIKYSEGTASSRRVVGRSESLRVAFGRSRLAAAALIGACAATLGVIFATPVGAVAQGVLALALVIGMLRSLVAIAWRTGGRGVSALALHRSRALGVRDARGCWRSGVVQDGSFVAPWLTIVRWRPEGARFDRTFVVLPDMVNAEDFRRLRVLLRWG